jgi:hypothetical protein
MEDESNKAKEVARTQTVDQIPSASIADSASASSSVEASREGVRAGSAAVPSPETVFNIGAVFRTLAVSQGPLFQLSRHETTIERSLHRALTIWSASKHAARARLSWLHLRLISQAKADVGQEARQQMRRRTRPCPVYMPPHWALRRRD